MTDMDPVDRGSPIRESAAPGLVLAAFLVAACSGTEPAPPAVGAIIISNVPTVPVLAGATVQLAATAVDATGGTIAGAAFSWQSSNPSIATVSGGGLVTGVGAGPVVITASSGGKQGTAELDVRAGGSIGTAGGVLTLLSGAVTLDVPPNSLPQSTTLLFRPVPDPAQNPKIVPGTIFELSPAGVFFFAGADLGLRYDPARIPSGTTEPSLQLYQLQGNTWIVVPGSTVNLPARTVTGRIGMSATYAVASTGVERIELAGPGLEGALYVGQTTQFTTQLFDAGGNFLVGRTVGWRSSNAAVATVSDGLVVGTGPGTVTITAEAEGKSASTTLEILVRPVADWAGAPEWVTFQGNPSHTGFVPVTVDPVRFSERWVSAVANVGVPLNPVTAQGNAVFVSTNTYFGQQKAWGLDLTTGAPLWSQDFGGIHAVHPPAVGGSRVFLTTSGHGDSYLFAFNASTGALAFQSPYSNQWSTYYAPVVLDQRVFMAGGGGDGMYSFDALTGAERWFVSTNQYNEWTPAVRDGLVYAYTGSYSPKVQVVSAATGAPVYEIEDPHFSWNGWSMKTAPVLGAANNLLAVQAGRLVSFDLTRRSLGWEKTGSFTGAVTVANGMLYTVNEGRLEVRNESDGALVWSWRAPNGSLTGTTVVTRNLLFARTEGAVYGVDLASRRQVWSYPATGHLALAAQGVLLIARPDGKLSAIGLK